MRVEGQIRDKKNEYNKISELQNYEPLIDKTVPKFQNPLYVWQAASPRTKTAFQKWLFPRGILYGDKSTLRTTETCLVYSILDTLDSESPVNCRRQDLNLHPINWTTTSTLRVYQFRHVCIFYKAINSNSSAYTP